MVAFRLYIYYKGESFLSFTFVIFTFSKGKFDASHSIDVLLFDYYLFSR